MDANFRIGQESLLQHQHGDGSWWPMEREHDSADHDAERSWLRRTIFRCSNCDHAVAVTEGGVDEEGEPERR